VYFRAVVAAVVVVVVAVDVDSFGVRRG